MKNDLVNYRDYAACLTQLLGRTPSPTELIGFEDNQHLLQINRRSTENDAYRITFLNDTPVTLLADGMILGSAIQLHSQEGGHRFYTVMFEEQGTVEEHYLMLDASVESAVVGGVRTALVQHVRLITIEDLVLRYNPVMYNLT
ncbi:hypothetical protein [Pontibacter burrus]|uniref:Uncharacterized protein n=1 Tax=Pontibacter burrus TaxID=2704466 RepID=A0A6B3LWX5_9BACT|nr:hypothetical protein [Pontibacter burrus]NEM99445.1 hypothetical protein [Pontibacter burrus]